MASSRRRRGRAYEPVYGNQWWDAEQPQYVACCDCGLVHRIYMRLRGGRVQMRWVRDAGETKRVRNADSQDNHR